MKLIQEEFKIFHQREFPNLKGAGLIALRKAYLSGYATGLENMLEVAKFENPHAAKMQVELLEIAADAFNTGTNSL